MSLQGSLSKRGVLHTTTCPHLSPTLTSRGPLHNCPHRFSYSWGYKRGSRACLLGHRDIYLEGFFFFCTVMRKRGDKKKKWGQGGTTHLMFRQHFTEALKMSSRGQAPWGDKIMTLLYSQWSKENQFLSQNLEEGRKKQDLPQLSSVLSFIHSEMLMQVQCEPGPGDAEMNG